MNELKKAMSAFVDGLHKQTGRWLSMHCAKMHDDEGKDLLREIEEALAMAFKAGAEWHIKQSPWVSVKDRLPETLSLLGNASSYVLVHLQEKGYDAIGCYCSDGRWLVNLKKDSVTAPRSVKVDYWMPIPSTPKGGAK